MNQDEQNAPTVIDDLTVNEDQATEVTGGVWYAKYQGIDGEAASRPSTPSVSEIVVTKVMDGS